MKAPMIKRMPRIGSAQPFPWRIRFHGIHFLEILKRQSGLEMGAFKVQVYGGEFGGPASCEIASSLLG